MFTSGDGPPSDIEGDDGMETRNRRSSSGALELRRRGVRGMDLHSGNNRNRDTKRGVGMENRGKDFAKGVGIMGFFFGSVMGIVLYSVVLFGAGALIGKPMYEWVRTFFPWNKG